MRHVLMSKSETPYNGVYYRDPISLDLSRYRRYDELIEYVITQAEIFRPDILMTEVYGDPNYSDMALWLAGVASTYELELGSTIELHSKDDIDNFYIENIK